MKREVNEEFLLKEANCHSLKDIRTLDLSDHGLTELDTGLFNKLTSLTQLDVSGNSITELAADLKLDSLLEFDCSDNCLTSVVFVKQFKKLRKLHIAGNEGLSLADDTLIAKVLRPSLQSVDDRDIPEKGVALYRDTLKPQIDAVWEAGFSEVYSSEIAASEFPQLQQELICTVDKCGIVGSNLTMTKFRKFMIEELTHELLLSVGKKCKSRRSSERTAKDSPSVRQSGKLHTRLSTGRTPQMDYSTGTPTEKSCGDSLSSTPRVVKPVKRLRDDSPKGTPSKRFKSEPQKTPTGFTILKSAACDKNHALPDVTDYDPALFLRCHSEGNNPADDETKVWQCAFEPRLGHPGETTSVLATCGGKLVCFIDCQTGKVVRRYKDNSKTESFYTLAWTTLEADGEKLKEDINILAVAGNDGQIKLIHPTQLVMFGVIEGHKGYISCLTFHSRFPNILFSGSKDKRILVWDIGVPDFNTFKPRRIAELKVGGTDPVSLVVSADCDMLLAGCEKSCYGWNINKVQGKDFPAFIREAHYEFVHPTEEGSSDDERVVDGLALLPNNCIVSKCVGHRNLYVWDLKQYVKERKSSRRCVKVQPLALLSYSHVEVDYVYPSTHKGLVLIGDDEGCLYMYDLRQLLKKKQPISGSLTPSKVLDWPEREADSRHAAALKEICKKGCDWVIQTTGDGNMVYYNQVTQEEREEEPEDFHETEIVVNCSAMSSDGNFLAYGTDANLVCLWRCSRT